jgi:Mrr N-terminal domain
MDPPDPAIPERLSAWRAALLAELASLEQQADALRAAMAERRSHIQAIDRLLGADSTSDDSASSDTSSEQRFTIHACLDTAFDPEVLTPGNAYWQPILAVLAEIGGRGRRRKVIELVGEKMKDVLTPADRRQLPSHGIRWEHAVAWQASHMRRVAGLLRHDSPRGVWEISDAGREWLAQHG